MSEYLQDPTFRSERSLLRQGESDRLRSRRRPIRGRRKICRRHDPMASCLIWAHFCYFIQRLGVYSQWKAKKKRSPNFLPTLLWQPTTQQLFPRTESGRTSLSIVTHRPPWPTKGRVLPLPPLNCHLKFLQTFALKIPIVDLEIFVLENFRVLNFCVKIFSWCRIPTKIF